VWPPRAITSHPRPWLYSARPTKRVLALYTITVDPESCVSRLDVTPKIAEQNRIVRTCKSEGEIINNKKLRSRYCTIEAMKLILTDTKHRAASLRQQSYLSQLDLRTFYFLYRVFQKKSSPLKTFWNIFTSVKSFCVKFCRFVGSSYLHISTNFCRFIFIFRQNGVNFSTSTHRFCGVIRAAHTATLGH